MHRPSTTGVGHQLAYPQPADRLQYRVLPVAVNLLCKSQCETKDASCIDSLCTLKLPKLP